MTALLDHATEVVVIAVEDLYDEVPPGFHDSLCGSVYDALALALARAQPEGWRLVDKDTPQNMKALFFLDYADDMKPEAGSMFAWHSIEERYHFGKYGCWSSIYKATHWMPWSYPVQPAAPNAPSRPSEPIRGGVVKATSRPAPCSVTFLPSMTRQKQTTIGNRSLRASGKTSANMTTAAAFSLRIVTCAL
jgi:hypothetical protein